MSPLQKTFSRCQEVCDIIFPSIVKLCSAQRTKSGLNFFSGFQNQVVRELAVVWLRIGCLNLDQQPIFSRIVFLEKIDVFLILSIPMA